MNAHHIHLLPTDFYTYYTLHRLFLTHISIELNDDHEFVFLVATLVLYLVPKLRNTCQ